jgi:hypothetical protein
MGLLSPLKQYICIDKLHVDKHTKQIFIEVKKYNDKNDRLTGHPITTTPVIANLDDVAWDKYFGKKADTSDMFALCYAWLKHYDKGYADHTNC